MSTTTTENEILALERQYWKAIQNGDAEECGRLSDDPCVVTGAQGVGQLTRANLVEMMKNGGGWKLESFEISEPIVRVVADDVATIAYKVSEKMTVDGKPLTLEAADSSTWVRRGGQWVCALHTEAVTGDPFGRDRKRK
jgi:hypothetical protein